MSLGCGGSAQSLINTITGITQEGLFRVNGSMKMVEQLRLQYERGEEVELVRDGDVYSAASLLKLFLRELPDGIITSALHPRFIQLYQGKWEVESLSLNALSFWASGFLVYLLCFSLPLASALTCSQMCSSATRGRKMFLMYLVRSGLFMIFLSIYICWMKSEMISWFLWVCL